MINASFKGKSDQIQNMVHFCGMLEIVVDLKLKLTSVQTAHVKVSWKTDFKVEKLYPPCLDLISSPSLSMKIQILGGKITENLGFKSPLRMVKFFCSFLFLFSNSP